MQLLQVEKPQVLQVFTRITGTLTVMGMTLSTKLVQTFIALEKHPPKPPHPPNPPKPPKPFQPKLLPPKKPVDALAERGSKAVASMAPVVKEIAKYFLKLFITFLPKECP